MHIIAGQFRRQRLIAPKGSHTRPTSNRLREALFNICQHKIEEASFLDLFAGSGAMGFEALSRGARSVFFIDSHPESLRCIKENASRLNVEGQIQIMRGEAFAMLKLLDKQGLKFDIIYADPPYRTKAAHTESFYSAAIIDWIDASPLLSAEGLLFVEEDVRCQPQPSALKTLSFIDSRKFGQAALQQYQKIFN